MPTKNHLMRWCLCVVGVFVSPVAGSPPPIGDDVALRETLRRHGLTEMLSQLIAENPPRDDVAAILAQRALALQLASDPNISPSEKERHIQKAVELLESLIRNHGTDARQFRWRLDLGRDVLYKQAEPYFNGVLFKGGSDADRVQLLQFAGKAADLLEALRIELQAEHNRIVELDPASFAGVRDSGLVEGIEALLPLASYFEQWAQFYRGLALDPQSPKAQRTFADVIRYMSVDNEFTTIPHAETGVQCQALWITGASQRLLGQYEAAMKLLIESIRTVEKLEDPGVKAELKWVAVLGRLELIKVLRDQERFEQAIEASGAFRRWADQELGGDYATLEAITLLEGTIYLHHGQALEDQGKRQEAKALREESRKPLIELAKSHPEHQDRLYRTVYQLLGNVSDVQALDAFEKNAYISGLISDVRKLSGEARSGEKDEIGRSKTIEEKLNEAIRVAELLIVEETDLARQLRPATLYNLAICLHEKGKSKNAVEALMKLAKDFPQSERARRASDLSCSIAYKMIGSADEASLADARALFVRVAQAMLEAYPERVESGRWRIPLGQVLDLTGEHAAAAKVYQDVSPTDGRYLDARFLQLQARRKAAGLNRDRSGKMNFKVVYELIQEALHFAEQARTARDESNDPNRRRILNEYSIGSELMAADLEASPVVGASAKALQRIVALREKNDLSPETLGHALRVQILALQSLGELDQASALVETYLNSESDRAGEVVEGLIESIQKEIMEDRRAGKADASRARGEEALKLAQQLKRWARRREGALVSGNESGLTLLLAETYLDAEQFEEALDHFDSCVGKFDGETAQERRRRSRLALGRAEALYRLGRYDEALNRFDEIWRGSPGNSEIWWRALVRNLECHDALQTPPAEILASIQQHRRLYPKMEYGDLKAELESLEKRLKERVSARSSAVER